MGKQQSLSKDTPMSWYDYGFRKYVPVYQRRANASRALGKQLKKGETASPVQIEGRKITTTFWGNAWCTNLQSYSDYSNRLPRGRTYVCNGSVVHLTIEKGRIHALVSGSDLYKVQIDIASYAKKDWQALKAQCSGKIGSLVELLQGKLSKAVMELVTNRSQGLFPKPKEITMRCSCPDYAGMCKHLAAVLYGVGHRLDSSPELLFQLRAVNHLELIEQALPSGTSTTTAPTLKADDLGAIFDIEIGDVPGPVVTTPIRKKTRTSVQMKKKPVAKLVVKRNKVNK
jgi:uncharacterized Zn finger protein